ncbi:hypothetical protein J2T12_004635 [Paenibacillus anaericanus]|nr:hypothetical protein [Paenibacillus anaericanus]
MSLYQSSNRYRMNTLTEQFVLLGQPEISGWPIFLGVLR